MFIIRLLIILMLCISCSRKHIPPPNPVDMHPVFETPVIPKPAILTPSTKPSLKLDKRVLTDAELSKLERKMDYHEIQDVLAKINKKARTYIADDIKDKKPLLVPVNFDTYRAWSPLPKTIMEARTIPKLIVVCKDIPFTGWYEYGRMKGDSLTCVGKQWGWTASGTYKVLSKAENAYSNLYPNAYGSPAWMPYALQIYGAVYMHAGDIIGPYCSHGCINLVMERAKELFQWADIGTPVVITDTLSNLYQDLNRVHSNKENSKK